MFETCLNIETGMNIAKIAVMYKGLLVDNKLPPFIMAVFYSMGIGVSCQEYSITQIDR